LLLAEAAVMFGAVIGAVYLRLGAEDSHDELLLHYGFYKAALATAFCLTAFYFYDLYDFLVMHDRRELVLRLVQALGLAWVALAITFYAFPQLMLGRGISLLNESRFQSARQVIDISGNGRTNEGDSPGPIRTHAALAGITVNGLVIANEEKQLSRYYLERVIGGPGAFVLQVNGFEDFARAMRQKFLAEISALEPKLVYRPVKE